MLATNVVRQSARSGWRVSVRTAGPIWRGRRGQQRGAEDVPRLAGAFVVACGSARRAWLGPERFRAIRRSGKAHRGSTDAGARTADTNAGRARVECPGTERLLPRRHECCPHGLRAGSSGGDRRPATPTTCWSRSSVWPRSVSGDTTAVGDRRSDETGRRSRPARAEAAVSREFDLLGGGPPEVARCGRSHRECTGRRS